MKKAKPTEKITSKNDPLQPSPALLCKLGSVVVHAQEALSLKGHDFDWEALKQNIQDPEVEQWLQRMDKLALIPKKR